MKRFAVRRSPIHGRGVFALTPLSAGDRLIEYRGTLMSWRAAVRTWQRNGHPGHTFFFGLSDGRVIDGGQGGNSSRWLNHACDPNCVAVEVNGRVFIDVAKDVRAGSELFLAYGLDLDSTDEQERAAYDCRCGSRMCRGTMLGT